MKIIRKVIIFLDIYLYIVKISLKFYKKIKYIYYKKNMNEIDFDKNFKECTFQPDLSKPKISLT